MLRRTASYLLFSICGALLVLSAIMLLLGASHKLVAVQTNSMRPTFRAGDALVVTQISPKQLHIGDIVTYRNPADMSITISHRLVSKRPNGFTAQGDAQQKPGPLIPFSSVIGKDTAVAPKVGVIITTLHTTLGMVIGCYVPALVIAGHEIWHLSRRTYRPRYRIAANHA